MRTHFLLPLALLALGVALASWACQETGPTSDEHADSPFVYCPATRDVWLSSIANESHFNMGATRRLKLKQYQEFALVDFDVTALRGKTVRRAFLYLKPAGGHRLGLYAGTDLRWITVSSVAHEWVEGESRRPGPDRRGRGATFQESSFGHRSWGFKGAKIWDVVLGNGNSLRFDGQLEPAADQGHRDWLRMELDTRLVQALVSRASHGLALFDGSTDVGANCFVKSRESGEGPFLKVEVGRQDTEPPSPPTELQVRAASDWATPTLGALDISLQVPRDTLSFDLRINGRVFERWQIPFAGAANERQSFVVVDLPPGSDVLVELAAVDAAGNRSDHASARGRVSSALEVPRLPASPFRPIGDEPPVLGDALIWAFPEVTKVDPVSAEVLDEPDSTDFRRKNAVWDGAGRSIRVAAAQGEIVSFQVAVEGRADDCRILVSPLEGPARIGQRAVKLWRNWYVGRHSEYAVPLGQTFDLPSSDNRVTGQKLQAVTVDLHVPRAAPAGEYEGTVSLSCDLGSVDLRLDLKVYDVALPDEIHFNVELNAYKGPGRAGSLRFVDSHRLAHYHRATINRVPYFQDGAVHDDWIPRVDDLGRVRDWSGFDARLGGLLDGSWFRDNPRSGVPVPSLYLPFFEGWPKDFRLHYNPGEEIPIEGRDADQKLRHDVLARPIQEAFDESFQGAMVTALEDFVHHFQEQGWNRTLFYFYLNNKPSYGYTLWSFDEPFEFLDWAAINFFARLVKKAIDDPEVYTRRWHEELAHRGLASLNRPRPTILFRADVSRPMWQGSVSDGLINAMYVNRVGFEMPELLRRAKLRMPATLNNYGSPNEVDESNWQAVAWCLKSFVNHFDGVLPWQSLGGEEAMRQPTTTALLIDGGRHGHVVASFRLHALRRGAQDCELLRLLQLRRGWSRSHVGLLVEQRLALKVDPGVTEESSALANAPLRARDFLELKEGVLQLLAQDSAR